MPRHIVNSGLSWILPLLFSVGIPQAFVAVAPSARSPQKYSPPAVANQLIQQSAAYGRQLKLRIAELLFRQKRTHKHSYACINMHMWWFWKHKQKKTNMTPVKWIIIIIISSSSKKKRAEREREMHIRIHEAHGGSVALCLPLKGFIFLHILND